MTTVTGKIDDGSQNPVPYAQVVFRPKTAPLFLAGGVIVLPQPVTVTCDANAAFSVQLVAGDYDVFSGRVRLRSISVPADDGNYTIDQLAPDGVYPATNQTLATLQAAVANLASLITVINQPQDPDAAQLQPGKLCLNMGTGSLMWLRPDGTRTRINV